MQRHEGAAALEPGPTADDGDNTYNTEYRYDETTMPPEVAAVQQYFGDNDFVNWSLVASAATDMQSGDVAAEQFGVGQARP